MRVIKNLLMVGLSKSGNLNQIYPLQITLEKGIDILALLVRLELS